MFFRYFHPFRFYDIFKNILQKLCSRHFYAKKEEILATKIFIPLKICSGNIFAQKSLLCHHEQMIEQHKKLKVHTCGLRILWYFWPGWSYFQIFQQEIGLNCSVYEFSFFLNSSFFVTRKGKWEGLSSWISCFLWKLLEISGINNVLLWRGRIATGL